MLEVNSISTEETLLTVQEIFCVEDPDQVSPPFGEVTVILWARTHPVIHIMRRNAC